ncbi:hypothetical protein PV327_000495 [Microctonus hyperodae]|uniref:Uncharacterized protein n=1 Tax=Microctonus hyperodae TaxID=165561 RepID=A0AA39G6U1_MICHY|nr:hypothetical protein PV327_000495 [Microctonus hyperodae]
MTSEMNHVTPKKPIDRLTQHQEYNETMGTFGIKKLTFDSIENYCDNSNQNFSENFIANEKLIDSIFKIPDMDFDSKKWQNIAKQQTCKAEKEGDLVGMLSKQLYLAGDQMQRMQTAKEWELKSKDQELANKKEKSQRITQLENSDYMYKQCLKLEHKILEMEKFLADYGLVWLGESNNNKIKNPDELSNQFNIVPAISSMIVTRN